MVLILSIFLSLSFVHLLSDSTTSLTPGEYYAAQAHHLENYNQLHDFLSAFSILKKYEQDSVSEECVNSFSKAVEESILWAKAQVKTESDYQQRFVYASKTCPFSLLCEGNEVYDSRKKKILSHRYPDVTVLRRNAAPQSVYLHHVASFIEFKRGDESLYLPDHRAQVIDYLRQMIDGGCERAHVLLFNGVEFAMFLIVSDNSTIHFYESAMPTDKFQLSRLLPILQAFLTLDGADVATVTVGNDMYGLGMQLGSGRFANIYAITKMIQELSSNTSLSSSSSSPKLPLPIVNVSLGEFVLKISKDNALSEWLENEAQIMKKIGYHDCLPALIDCGYVQFGGQSLYGIIMESGKEGIPMTPFTRSDGSIRKQPTRDQIRNIVEGLFYIHKKGFVHRDVRPANIGFCGQIAVLYDFNTMILDERMEVAYAGTVKTMSRSTRKQYLESAAQVQLGNPILVYSTQADDIESLLLTFWCMALPQLSPQLAKRENRVKDTNSHWKRLEMENYVFQLYLAKFDEIMKKDSNIEHLQSQLVFLFQSFGIESSEALSLASQPTTQPVHGSPKKTSITNPTKLVQLSYDLGPVL